MESQEPKPDMNLSAENADEAMHDVPTYAAYMLNDLDQYYEDDDDNRRHHARDHVQLRWWDHSSRITTVGNLYKWLCVLSGKLGHIEKEEVEGEITEEDKSDFDFVKKVLREGDSRYDFLIITPEMENNVREGKEKICQMLNDTLHQLEGVDDAYNVEVRYVYEDSDGGPAEGDEYSKDEFDSMFKDHHITTVRQLREGILDALSNTPEGIKNDEFIVDIGDGKELSLVAGRQSDIYSRFDIIILTPELIAENEEVKQKAWIIEELKELGVPSTIFGYIDSPRLPGNDKMCMRYQFTHQQIVKFGKIIEKYLQDMANKSHGGGDK